MGATAINAWRYPNPGDADDVPFYMQRALEDVEATLSPAYTAYAAALSAVTTAPTNWTAASFYRDVTRQVHYHGVLTAGGAFTPGNGNFDVALPFPARGFVVGKVLGVATAGANSSGLRIYTASLLTASKMRFSRSTDESILSNAGPGSAWLAGGYIAWNFVYERT